MKDSEEELLTKPRVAKKEKKEESFLIWGKMERFLVFSVLLLTTLVSGVLYFLSRRP